ncbi:MAG: hypothetical protein ACKVOH_06220 [Chlamydiales bacterium]
MQSLFAHLGSFSIIPVGRLSSVQEVTQEQFLEKYAFYVAALKRGERATFSDSFVFTTTFEAIQVIEAKGQYIMKPKLPIIQLQESRVRYSHGEFHTQVFGPDSIAWGIRFSYPQLFQDETTGAISKVDQIFPNTELFRRLQKWVRAYTQATPFSIEGEKINVPVRLGKASFSWIAVHPDLQEEVGIVC